MNLDLAPDQFGHAFKQELRVRDQLLWVVVPEDQNNLEAIVGNVVRGAKVESADV